MIKIVVDTSVYIDYLRSGKGLYIKLLEIGKGGSTNLYTPSIVILELSAGRSMSGKIVVSEIKRTIKPTKIIDLTRQLAEKAGELLRNKFIDETEDAIIAATTLYLGAQLATRNKKHFEKVKGLKIFS